jgi:hypothetical protein
VASRSGLRIREDYSVAITAALATLERIGPSRISPTRLVAISAR